MHSYFSDGIYSPDEVLKRANENNIEVVSLTDHDTIAGIKAISDKNIVSKFINGIELTCCQYDFGLDSCTPSLHILGYGIDINNKNLNKFLKERMKKKENILKEFKEEVQLLHSDKNAIQIGYQDRIVPHIGDLYRYLAEDDYLPQYVKEELAREYSLKYNKINILPQNAINLIKEAGGVPVWAHPYITYCNGRGITLTNEEIEKMLSRLKEWGMEGVEADYLAFAYSQTEFLCDLATKNNLYISSGSDFHGYEGREQFIYNKNPQLLPLLSKLINKDIS
jgi:predicted metal-dependent phosphoesterase TrpH